MKRLFFILAILLFINLPAPQALTARAEQSPQAPRYAVADGTTIWFYSEPNEYSGLFILPYTYYVLILNEGTPFSTVRYMDDVLPYKSVTGYCKTAELKPVDFVPARPYLHLELKAEYALAAGAGTSMGSGLFNKVEKTFTYYGESYSGTSKFYYVYSDGVFDYIPAMQEVVYELNTDYLVQDTSGELPSAQEPENTSPSLIGIGILCLAAAAVIIVAVLALRGKKPPVQEQEEF